MTKLTAIAGKKKICATCQHFVAAHRSISGPNIIHPDGGMCALSKSSRNANQSCDKWLKWNELKRW